MTTTLYIIRHGQTDANAGRVIQGQLVDGPLNETGREQAVAVANRLSSETIDTIYCSTLRRARETAAAVRGHHPRANYVEFPELMEMCWGVMEGQSFSNENRLFFERMKADWDTGLYDESVDGGESINDVLKRANYSFEQISRQSEGKTAAVVTHGRFIRVLLGSILNDYSLQRMDELMHDNTAVSKLTITAKGVAPEFLMCTQHLEGTAIDSQ